MKIEPWLGPASPPAQYIDIFDDAIYQFSNLEESPLFRAQLNAIRLHAFWSILLRGAFIVPEQWLFSSLSFNLVAWEILEHYEEVTKVRKGSTQEIHRIHPPVRICFRSREKADRWSIFPIALRDILANNSPIRLFPNLDPINNQEDSGKREAYRNLVESQIDTGDPSGPFSLTFADQLTDIFPYLSVTRKFASNLQNLLRQAKYHTSFDQSDYQEGRGLLVQKVQNLVFEDQELFEKFPERISAWRILFKKIHKDKIKVDDIMKIWTVSKELNISHQDKRSIEHIGRFIMHDTLAGQIGADYQSAAVGLYELDKPDEFDDELVAKLGSNRKPMDELPKLILPESYMQIASTTLGDEKLKEEIFWPEIWKSLWAAYHDRKLNELRLKLIQGIDKISIDRLHEAGEWDDLFDFLNRTMTTIRFSRNRTDSRLLDVMAKGKDDLALLGGAVALFSSGVMSVSMAVAASFLGAAAALRTAAAVLPNKTLADVEIGTARWVRQIRRPK